MNNLIIGHRNPTDKDKYNINFWLNYETKEFFQLIENFWVSLTKEYIINNQPERLSPEDHIVDDNEMVSDSLNSTNK